MTDITLFLDTDAREDGEFVVQTTLAKLFEENEFTDAERNRITDAIAAKGAYRGGGGAQPEFLVTLPMHGLTLSEAQIDVGTREKVSEFQALRLHSGHDWSLDEKVAAWAFHSGPNFQWVTDNLGKGARWGWEAAHRRCYALGVLDAALDYDGRYPQFSAAWEAWADGYNDADTVEATAVQRFDAEDNTVTTYPEAPFWLILIFEDEEWKQADTAHTEQQARELRDAYRASHGVAEAVRAFGVLA